MSEAAIEEWAKRFYALTGYNYACLPIEEAWLKDRENVREHYRRLAAEQMRFEGMGDDREICR